MARRATPPAYAPGKCPNCDAPSLSRRALYCGERCRQIAELVRYARRKLAEGIYERPDIAEAIMIRRGLLLAGSFYDKRGRAVSEETRQELRARSSGRCEKCGRQFGEDGDARFTVQHSMTDQGLVLEAWCYRCNIDDVMSQFRPINPPTNGLPPSNLTKGSTRPSLCGYVTIMLTGRPCTGRSDLSRLGRSGLVASCVICQLLRGVGSSLAVRLCRPDRRRPRLDADHLEHR